MASAQQVALARAHRGGATSLNKAARQVVPAFLQKLYEMVNDPSTDSLICWTDSGDAFIVLDHDRFAREVLGRWFKHQNFSSFVRQLNMYGFHKIPHLQQGVLKSESDTEFYQFEHPNFRRGQPDLLCLIQRQKQATDKCGAVDAHQAPALTSAQMLDLNQIMSGLNAIKRHQTSISSDLEVLRQSNEELWKEAMKARVRYKEQSATIAKIIKFLATFFEGGVRTATPPHDDNGGGSPSRAVVPTKPFRLMIEDGRANSKMSVDSDHSGRLRGSREPTPTPISPNPQAHIETPGSTMSPSIAPSDVFTPASEVAPTPTATTAHIPDPSATVPPPSFDPQAMDFDQNDTGPWPGYQSMSPNTLAAMGGQQNQDSNLQSILANALQSPGAMQKILSALSPSYNFPDTPAQPQEPAASDPNAQPFSPFDFTRTLEAGDTGDFDPQQVDLASYAPLAGDAARMENAYKSVADIEADVDGLQNKFESFMERIGYDPEHATACEEPIAGPSNFSTAAGNPTSTQADGGAPALQLSGTDDLQFPSDFDFEKFLSNVGQHDGENGAAETFGLADDLVARNATGAPRSDPSREQLTAFLDEVGSQSEGTASPTTVKLDPPSTTGSPGRKRKSDAAELSDRGNTDMSGGRTQAPQTAKVKRKK